MVASHDADARRELQNEIEAFLQGLEHPVLVEEGVELLDLTAAEWRCAVEFGKVMFHAWNPGRSMARRVEEIAYRDRGRLGLFVRKPGGRETITLELRELDRSPARASRAEGRTQFRQALAAMLKQEYRGWQLEHVSTRSDREHSFSAWYTRGLARQGRTGWAFLGLSPEEGPAAGDAVLAFGLIWLDWLRSQAGRITIPGLRLFLPPTAIKLTAQRVAWLNQRAVQIELCEWQPGQAHPRPVDARDVGNVETHLAPHSQRQALIEGHRERLRDLLGEYFERVQIVPEASGMTLSLRVLGLEIARVEGQLAPRIYFGLEGSWRRLGRENQDELRRFVGRVLELRRAASPEPQHEFYRLQSERWLESLLVADITRLDPDLSPAYVYPQVPAFAAGDRSVLDILGVTRQGRLAVMELKLSEEINLPMQALDYWLRVKQLNEGGRFTAQGYFPGVELSPAPPRLYLVAPEFRFHSTTGRLLRYFDPIVEVVQVGLSDRWREGLRIPLHRDQRAAPCSPPIDGGN
jgi:hypothetical protein